MTANKCIEFYASFLLFSFFLLIFVLKIRDMANEGIKSLSILDKDYLQWIKELSTRFRRSQVKASVRVNQVMLQFYWELGRDIVEKKAESRWGSGFMRQSYNRSAYL